MQRFEWDVGRPLHPHEDRVTFLDRKPVGERRTHKRLAIARTGQARDLLETPEPVIDAVHSDIARRSLALLPRHQRSRNHERRDPAELLRELAITTQIGCKLISKERRRADDEIGLAEPTEHE